MPGRTQGRINTLKRLVEKYYATPLMLDTVDIYRREIEWLERRCAARDMGERLSGYEKKHPEPFKVAGLDFHIEKQKLNKFFRLTPRTDGVNSPFYEQMKPEDIVAKLATRDPNSRDWYKNTTIGKEVDIPSNVMREISRIREAKHKIKLKSEKAYQEDSVDELKELAKIAKRLDREEKILIFKYDFNAFDEYMFQEIQDRVATPPFHNEMFKLYQHSKRACVVCPRGFAKSTNARKYLIHQIVNRETNYLVLVGASEEMAGQNLRWIRDQLSDNPRLVELYGVFKNKDKWAETEFEVFFKNDKDAVVFKHKAVAKGAGQKIRGMNEKGRPDLFYIDDLEEDEQVESRERREKLRQWFLKALMPARAKNGRVIITGTILHMDSLLRNISLNKIKDHIEWDVLFFQAINKDEDGNEYSLWEEHKPLAELIAIREGSPITFAQEYQNNPRAGIQATFQEKHYHYYDESQIRIDYYKKCVYLGNDKLSIMMTTDYAYSKKSGADYTVYMITGMDRNSRLYILEYLRFRESDPKVQIDELFTLLKKWYCDFVVMEQQQYQHAIKRFIEIEMEDRGMYFHIEELNRNDGTKFLRIKGLQQPISSGKIFWLREHTELENELSQVTSTSLGEHDDIIDALGDAWAMQIQAFEENPDREPEINTMEWLIAQGAWDENGE